MKRARQALLLIAVGANLSLALPPARAQGGKAGAHPAAVKAPPRAMTPTRVVIRQVRRPPAPIIRDGEAEARLIEVYRLIGQANSREAISKAESLVRDHPNFQLAQLVYGDLLSGRTRPVRSLGDVPDTTAQAGATILAELRQESALRLRALRERPAPGTVPSQFLSLSPRTRHAIAVDTSRARLYLFENTPTGLKLLADYYISVGKLGIEKSAEGDLRTPLGVYFITSNLDPRSLTDFYGAGALPINYPNQLDIKRGKTGGGIWLHGAPSNQFARAPLSTEGCVALANPDLQRIIKTVEIGTTPVVIAQSLQWVSHPAKADTHAFEDALKGWTAARSSGDVARILSWYAPDFTSFGKTLAQFTPVLQAEVKQLAGRAVDIKDVSYLRWIDSSDTMVVTLGEVVRGARTGRTKRQYWARQGNQWKIFFEGVI
ncbi:L,D-transpeptidase family protein [Polaromonas sp.]|uniref:L,D-transpeptidase family protein n=1 Tax=Polaromonas sp. TaxID=1869339 RepID=UPI002BCC70D6|nr:L,D-transpeptidase family protein [Polaromonas sp.]HQS33001.1 L,D-transpeptidase family protein [Polaromonas sp.]HQS91573.1 L,D-transpeptidase family protein [Polaromonas sp.]